MNLELLDPFRRQIPDRVDATLNLPSSLHPNSSAGKTKPSKDTQGTSKSNSITNSELEEDDDRKAANHVAFNRRGGYVAVGYGSGTVAVYDVLSRTLCGLYRSIHSDPESTSEAETRKLEKEPSTPSEKDTPIGHGVTSLSWSRRSRTLLAGSAGDALVRLIDTTHPSGPEDCCLSDRKDEKEKVDTRGDEDEGQSSAAETTERKRKAYASSFKDKPKIAHHRRPHVLQVSMLAIGPEVKGLHGKHVGYRSQTHASLSASKRYPSIHFDLPLPIGSTLQIHPKDTCAGLAALNDGSLVAFWVPVVAWEDQGTEEKPVVRVSTIYKNEENFITCAAFDQYGERIYAATRTGVLLGFEVAEVFQNLATEAMEAPTIAPGFSINIQGGATAWHLAVSRNGHNLVVNSADGTIRLYQTKSCWSTPEEVERPKWVFQDVVSKVRFASCDFSGDGEYIMGGANGSENKYELYIWNASSGSLMDKLTGAAVDLYSVAWHPTRSFLAVAASDGIVDIWGPRINWTAFAPDFQALPQNVEYVECEDEFDIPTDGSDSDIKNREDEGENVEVDILTVDPVPVFASDSEGEEDVFHFETKVKRIFGLYTN